LASRTKPGAPISPDMRLALSNLIEAFNGD
jgi:hypothetical protein